MKKFNIFLFVVFCSCFLFAQNNPPKTLKFKIVQEPEWYKKRNQALQELIATIEDKIDSVYIFSSQAGLACVTKDDTLIYIRIVRGKEKTNTDTDIDFELVKLKTKKPIKLNTETIERMYKVYIELTFQKLRRGEWEFYQKKRTPIKFKNYEFVVLEEYLEKDIADVVKKHF